MTKLDSSGIYYIEARQYMKNKEVPTLIYSRVSGYYNPTVNFNKGKRSEFEDRKVLKVPENLKSYSSLSL